MIDNNYILQTREDLAEIINANNYQKGVEIGVDQGNFSCFLLGNTKLYKLYLVDPWEAIGLAPHRILPYMGKDYVFEGNRKLRIDYGNLTLENLKERLKVFHNKGIIRQGLSEDIVSEFKDESLDFIYIDGDHTYEGCKKDVELWWPKLRVGGLFSGHDYKNRPRNNKEAKRAVDEYFDKLGITVNKTMGERCPSFWWIKE